MDKEQCTLAKVVCFIAYEFVLEVHLNSRNILEVWRVKYLIYLRYKTQQEQTILCFPNSQTVQCQWCRIMEAVLQDT